jgi:hypothetical protein
VTVAETAPLISGADPADQITQPAQARDGPDRGILNDADLLGDPQEFDRQRGQRGGVGGHRRALKVGLGAGIVNLR